MTKQPPDEAIAKFKKVEQHHAQMVKELNDFRRKPTWRDRMKSITPRRLLITYGVILAVVALPFVIIHLAAKPDDAPISLLQHLVAALANFFGPWGVAIVRVVDFPNAGMRSFSWTLAGGLSLFGTMLVAFPLCVKKSFVQFICILLWLVFLVVWFGVGLMQIADGLL